ncbi:MAG: hypothetical protein MPJ50_01980 [Pirellulales bacterium]|nr:hypothetical protein [Pirellulales bacterium]
METLATVVLVFVIVVVAIASSILKVAVGIANRFIPSRPSGSLSMYSSLRMTDAPRQLPPQQPGGTTRNPYQAPASQVNSWRDQGETDSVPAILVPGFGKAVQTVVLRGIVECVVGFIIGLISGALDPRAVQALAAAQDPLATLHETASISIRMTLVHFLVSFLLGVVVLKMMLLTSYRKACLVQLIEIAIGLLIYGVIGGIVFFLVLITGASLF